MSIPLERARSRRPITWLTILGVILLPALIGGILVIALYNPTSRLDAMNAAIVNDDQPVTIEGQYVPLGRQLSAGLVEGSGDADSNLTWTISNDEDAAAGLADGTYAAIVTIPENFSAAATSTRPGEIPEQATIEVTTPPDSLIVDDAITAQITSTAASLTGQAISTQYLENVFLGFTTLGDQLGEAADGADQLADGAQQSADGSAELASGLQQLSSGAGQLSSAAHGIADGANQLAGGQAAWAAGANEASAGLNQLSGGANALVAPSQQIAGGLRQFADQVQGISVPQSVIDAAQEVADNSTQLKDDAAARAAQLQQIASDCYAQSLPANVCDTLQQVADDATAALPTIDNILDNSQQIATGLAQINELPAQVTALADGATQLSAGIAGVASGVEQSAAGVGSLAGSASTISSQTSTLAAGVSQWADGTDAWASGAARSATGATTLSDGLTQLADGTRSLADGLHTAVEQLPSYTDAQAASLAEIVADPVAAEGVGSDLFGASAIPLLTALALWFGALGSFVVLRAFPARTLASRSPSVLLALRSLAPAAAIGAVQGLLVAGIVQISAGYDWGDWSIFAGVSILVGVAFAAVNQALVAVFAGAGRWIAALVGVLAVATGIVSTVPGVLTAVDAVMPVSPAYNAMLGALTGSGGVSAGIAGLVIWGGLAFAATILAVATKRTTTARAILATPATS
ncbi:YhgE/Pip domain-containing protein [Microbacterium sp. NPDC076895]|uniref:YhgE/Pip domain-containing protein n=1 Tax=Microbacterium sp. NPDC076895 TaxID=3154957 RepID=UPI00342223A9